MRVEKRVPMVMDSECFDWKIKTKAAAAAVVVAFAISNGICKVQQ